MENLKEIQPTFEESIREKFAQYRTCNPEIIAAVCAVDEAIVEQRRRLGIVDRKEMPYNGVNE